MTATGGTYTLIIELTEPTTVGFGAAGSRRLTEGAYAYVGSALGGGGFTRVERHRELAAGEREVRHWHVDYLLGDSAASVVGDVRTPDRDVECAVADVLKRRTAAVAGLGASDCGCSTHLFRGEDASSLEATVVEAHDAV